MSESIEELGKQYLAAIRAFEEAKDLLERISSEYMERVSAKEKDKT